MAVLKKYLKSKPICKVTFELKDLNVKNVSVVGNFNNWNTKASPLTKFKNGKFKITLDLEANNSYEFRYFADGSYINDSQADGYNWNNYASADNCILTL